MRLSARNRTTSLTIAVGLLATVAAVLGLGALPDLTRTRLPGAAGGSDTYTVTVSFADALDLVPNSSVRVADVAVGRVAEIKIERDQNGYAAVATLEINDSVDLPAETAAAISSTSLLGEKYVALIAPTHGTGNLRDTGSIPRSRTTQDLEVEQLLASIGALLNGGGLQQLSTITAEFSTALHGRENDTRALLGDLEAIVDRLNHGRPALVAALESTARLSRAFADQNEVLGRAIDDLDPATGILAEQVDDLRRALGSLDQLSTRATNVIRRSTEDTVASLAALAPVARQVGKVADQLPAAINTLATYPLADNSVRAFSGAYSGITGPVVVDLDQLLSAIVPTSQDTSQPVAPTDTDPTTPLLPPLDALPDALGVPDLVGGLAGLLNPRTGGPNS